MYYLHHYKVQWDRVKTLDDVKRILVALDFAFERTCDVSGIQDLVELVEKPKIGVTPL